MKIGNKTLLFGTHNPVIHTYFVLKAWIYLYNTWPNWKELAVIALHDIGYFNKRDLDGLEGQDHPALGAKILGKIFGREFHDMSLYHSRSLAKLHNKQTSKLCAPDKLSIILYPKYLYLALARLSGEIYDYKKTMFMSDLSDEEWFDATCHRNIEWVRKNLNREYLENIIIFEKYHENTKSKSVFSGNIKF